MKQLFCSVPITIFCLCFLKQTYGQGIEFISGLSWKQVKEKAKVEGKHIFVDCYTTWCGPCKTMDRDVYTNDSVGAFFKKRFISVKVQMDKGVEDSDDVQPRYLNAAYFEKEYKVRVYPTYLFFSPDGVLTYKDSSLQNVETFIAIAIKAIEPGRVYIDPYTDYYKLKQQYFAGKKAYRSMPYMITKATQAGETNFAQLLGKEYYQYLQRLPKQKLYKRENIQFIGNYLQSSSDPFFGLFFPDEKRANKAMGNTFFAAKVIDRLVLEEESRKVLGARGFESGVAWGDTPQEVREPDWDILYNSIKGRFNETVALRSLLTAQIRWYGNFHRWKEWRIANVKKIEMFGTDTTDAIEDVNLNGVAWNIFMESDDTSEIYSAIRWMAGVASRHCCQPMGVEWDTYAQLLHKAGRTNEALVWEFKAIQEAKNANAKYDVKLFSACYEAMRAGKPTWGKNYAEIEMQVATN